MPRPVTLSVPQPCHESWHQMTPAQQGRHCAACQKIVIDFTQLSDYEIINLISQSSDSVCGRFTDRQLNRPLQQPVTAPSMRWQTWLAAAAVTWGLRETMPAAVHEQAPVEQRVPATKTDSNSVPLLTKEPIVLRGRVIDQQENQPLPGVTVLLKGTQIGVASGADGTFELIVPTELLHPKINKLLVVFACVGYVRQEIPASKLLNQPLIVPLTVDTTPLLGEVVITDLRKPWPWHPRVLWSRIRYAFRR
ncbi:carboxypeptidase-like regulatory domain-containing protein [Hymenobacter sp. BT491]|uniref:carboxypeptidase-like regulatory domain-containing protein n=1 Tax=Hymenobacter sp. BT491 TaxID=2766779 RepID=UPI001653724D|nr:carboxypeptidase-like regulatory domain-containing protein [Hymenobacter sp. BT491]MBC6991659.1 carboxypeptidase-like regulatory domain-containing protein [Hymenobacter sp. BT491]